MSTYMQLKVENCLYFCESFAISTKSVYKLTVVMCIKYTNYTYSLQYKRSTGLFIIAF